MSQITTHILDTARGCPAADVAVKLIKLENDVPTLIATGFTDADGRISNLVQNSAVLDGGNYQIRFETGNYFQALDTPVFYPRVDVLFTITEDGQHYHIPLLLSPYGYSTYRGS